MNFPFEINKILPEEITKIDSKLQVCRQYGQDRFGYQALKKMLFEIVDKMGYASAKAQKLPGNITTGTKLENSNHHLYIMKDVSGEKNCVIGFLKVGPKKLFVYDPSKKQHEVDPMCVLDFYVHESRQRMGCGRKLFDYMLVTENIPVRHMGIDRPSPKFLSFLKKHYKLHAQIPQVNNYVIFEGFFNGRRDATSKNSRFTSSGYPISSVNTSQSRPNSGRKSSTPLSTLHINPHQQQPTQQNHGNYPIFSPSNSKHGSRHSPSFMAANERMYSRHGATPPNPRATPPYRKATPPSSNRNQITNGIGIGEQPTLASFPANSSSNRYNKTAGGVGVHVNNDAQSDNNNNKTQGMDSYSHAMNYNKMASPYMQYSMGTKNTAPYYGQNSQHLNMTNSGRVGSQQQEILNESHQPSSAPNFSSSRNTPNGAPSGTGSANGFLPDIRSGSSSQQANMGNHQKNSFVQLPPSGKRNNPSEPPVLQRDGPPAEYRDMLNMHQNYQGRNGRFIVSDTRPAGGISSTNPSAHSKPPQRPSTYEQSYGGNNNNNDWNWSMSGYLREQRMKQGVSNRYNPGRLW